MKTTYFKIPIDVYGYTVCVSIGQTDEELWNCIKKIGLPKSEFNETALYADERTDGHAVLYGTGYGLIRLRWTQDIPLFQSTLSHEIFHMVYFIMRDIGMKLTKQSDEAYAYLIGFITRKVYENILKSKNNFDD